MNNTKQSFIISVANQKGGVAKTTTTLSLGGALVQYGQKVLLIDLDPQANLTLSLSLDPAKIRNSIADVFLKNSTIDSIIRDTSIPGLYLVPSNFEMAISERILPNRTNHEIILRDALDSTHQKGYFDYIILDCPPSIGPVTVNALSTAQLLIIPTQPEYFSVNALRSMMNVIREIRSSTNPDLVYRILITMLDRRNRIHRTLTEQIHYTFKDGLMQTNIETDTKLRESTIFGLPITHYKQKTRSAIQYSTLAQELIEYATQKSPSSV